MCVRIALITPEPCEARAFTSGDAASSTTGQSATNTARNRSSNGRFRILANSAILKFYESDAYTCQCDGNLWPVGFEKKKRDGLKNGKTG